MATFFVLYDEFTRCFVRAGKRGGLDAYGWTYSLNTAKHFTSEWSARNYMRNHSALECLTVKKIVRQ